MSDHKPRLALFLPTYNAGPYLDALLPALKRQTLQPDRFLAIDSSSRDDTAERLRAFGAEVEIIPQAEFNHGGTRRKAAERLSDADILLMLTQDAIPAEPETIERLVAAFQDDSVGLAYGRQLPRPEARAVERHARQFNYPAESAVRSLEDKDRLGLKTVFCSNSFAAYRMQALQSVGSFPQDAVFAEDQIVSGQMVLKGWRLAYMGDAPVIHSHDYTITEEFKRYFDVGLFHARNGWLRESFGRAEGEGARFVRSEIAYLARHEPLSIPGAALRTGAKYLGYRLGLNEHRLSRRWKAKVSMASYYWKREA